MSKINLDLAKFKHKHSTPESTTVVHPDGHEVTFKHASLPKEALAQLSALPKADATSADKGEQSAEGRQKFAHGGESVVGVPTDINQIADATAQDAAQAAVQNANPANQVRQAYQEEVNKTNYNPNAGHIGSYSVGYDPEKTKADYSIKPDGSAPSKFDPQALDRAKADVAAKDAASKAASTEMQMSQQKQNDAAAALGYPTTPSIGATEAGPADMGAMGQAAQQPAGGASTPPAVSSGDPDGMFMSGYNLQQKGIADNAKAQGDLGKLQADNLQNQITAQQSAQDQFKASYQDLDAEHQAFVHDLENSHIDPEKYWQDHSKIAAGIGMILSGFNPTGKPNAAMEMMKNGMERNIQAQMANLGTKKTLLEANMRQYGNLRDAADMTRVMQNEMAAKQIQMSAAKMASPLAKAQAEQASGQLKAQASAQLREFAMRRSLIALSTNGGGNMSDQAIQQTLGYMEAMGSPQAKEMRSRYMPGYTLASNPIPEAVRSQVATSKTLNDMFNQSLELSKKYGGMQGIMQAVSDPTKRAQINNVAQTLQSQLIGQIKQAQHDGVYKESEAEYLLGQVGGNPISALANINSVPHIRELQALKQQELNQTLSTLGLKPNVPQQQAVAAQPYKAKGFKPVGK